MLEKTRSPRTGRALYNLGGLALDQERYEPAASYLERALPIIREVDIRHSHEIELDAKRYRNPFEVSALQMLIDIYSQKTACRISWQATWPRCAGSRRGLFRRALSPGPAIAGAPFRRQG